MNTMHDCVYSFCYCIEASNANEVTLFTKTFFNESLPLNSIRIKRIPKVCYIQKKCNSLYDNAKTELEEFFSNHENRFEVLNIGKNKKHFVFDQNQARVEGLVYGESYDWIQIRYINVEKDFYCHPVGLSSLELPEFEHLIPVIKGDVFDPVECMMLRLNMRGPSWIRFPKEYISKIVTTTNKLPGKGTKSAFELTMNFKDIHVCLEEDIKKANLPNTPSFSVMYMDIKYTIRHEAEEVRKDIDWISVKYVDSVDSLVSVYSKSKIKSKNLLLLNKKCLVDANQTIHGTDNVSVEPFDDSKTICLRFLNLVASIDPDIIVGHGTIFESIPTSLNMIDILTTCYKSFPDSNYNLGKNFGCTYSKKHINEKFKRIVTDKETYTNGFVKGIMAGRILCDTASQKFITTLPNNDLVTVVDKLGLWKKINHSNDEGMEILYSPKVSFYTIDEAIKKSEYCMAAITLIEDYAKVLYSSFRLAKICGSQWTLAIENRKSLMVEHLLMHHFQSDKRGFILPMKNKEAKKDYEGGKVLEPEKGLYENHVGILDFEGCYPHLFIQNDICHSTLLEYTDESSNQNKSPKSKSIFDMDIEEAIEKSKTRIKWTDEETSYEDRLRLFETKGVISSMLKSLVLLKAVLKKDIEDKQNKLDELKYLKETDIDLSGYLGIDEEIEALTLELSELKTFYQTLKELINSVYGCLAHKENRFFDVRIAKLITRLGRQALMMVSSEIQKYEPEMVKVIYGDTDSLFLLILIQGIKETIEMLEKIKRHINAKLGIMRVSIDGLFKSLMMFNKKHYAGSRLNLPFDESKSIASQTKLTTKGIDSKKRDWCGYIENLINGILEIVLINHEKPKSDANQVVEQIKEFIKRSIDEFKSGDVSLKNLIITKQIGNSIKEYERRLTAEKKNKKYGKKTIVEDDDDDENYTDEMMIDGDENNNELEEHGANYHINAALKLTSIYGFRIRRGMFISYIVGNQDMSQFQSDDDIECLETCEDQDINSAIRDGISIVENNVYDIMRSFSLDEKVKNLSSAKPVDLNWYLHKQVFPPLQRLFVEMSWAKDLGLVDWIGQLAKENGSDAINYMHKIHVDRPVRVKGVGEAGGGSLHNLDLIKELNVGGVVNSSDGKSIGDAANNFYSIQKPWQLTDTSLSVDVLNSVLDEIEDGSISEEIVEKTFKLKCDHCSNVWLFMGIYNKRPSEIPAFSSLIAKYDEEVEEKVIVPEECDSFGITVDEESEESSDSKDFKDFYDGMIKMTSDENNVNLFINYLRTSKNAKKLVLSNNALSKHKPEKLLLEMNPFQSLFCPCCSNRVQDAKVVERLRSYIDMLKERYRLDSVMGQNQNDILVRREYDLHVMVLKRIFDVKRSFIICDHPPHIIKVFQESRDFRLFSECLEIVAKETRRNATLKLTYKFTK